MAFHKKKKIIVTGGLEGNVCLSNWKSGNAIICF